MTRRSSEAVAILWDLKLRGDVNENHAGGNAMATLRERLTANGVVVDPKILSNRITQLRGSDRIKVLSKGRRSYAIRLAEGIDPEDFGPNPFSSQALVPIAQAERGLLNGQREWPMEHRLQLAVELLASVQADLQDLKVKLG